MKTTAPQQYRPKNLHLDKRVGTILTVAASADDEELIDTKAVSEWIGTTQQWLTIARSSDYGPPFHRISKRRIMYRRGDVRKWLMERRHASTKEYAR